ncbi:TPA: hypothetical protein N0F65_012673 [Lagenidium giganteum]|uniref:Beta-glucosidase n=1 Tax=Lagenidium giganteum TaxID=4803 RepID=A0AAV2YLA8_9STRA|nr:TPA: hypothetical protein N0F65_012673 [Lagenidium giganteum]
MVAVEGAHKTPAPTPAPFNWEVLFPDVGADVGDLQEPRCFPGDFLFGSATAAYQVEGGWNQLGRSPSIWDEFCRAKPGLQCANVADDFLHRYKDDIELMVETGLNSFRFSISWSRAMTWDAKTKRMVPNPEGIAFYHALVDELRLRGIVPIVTLYHWDLPADLHHELDPQGWLNPAIVDHFVEYAELMFNEFGDTIDMWSTFNEPWTFTTQGYGNGQAAPGLRKSDTNTYTVAHNVLLSHAKAVQRFRELKSESVVHPDSRIGIVLNADYSYPLNSSDPVDIAAAERKMEFGLGWFLKPIVSGEYPAIMRERAGDRLPTFSSEEQALVKGSYDLFMLNHYSSKVVTDCTSPLSHVNCSKQSLGWERDLGIDETRPPPGARLSSLNDEGKHNCNWFTGYPQGYMDTIKWMHQHNKKADILLTENGWCGNETIDNLDQLWYYQSYLGEVHKAITKEKIPIIGYTAWSFIDNYEWGSFKPRFGLYYVNFTEMTGKKDADYEPRYDQLTRTARIAAKWYAQVASHRCLDGRSRNATQDLHDQEVKFSTLLSNLLICAVFAPIVFAVVVSASAIRRRMNARSAESNEYTPLLG